MAPLIPHPVPNITMGVSNFDIVDAAGGVQVNGTTVITSAGAITADIQATAGSISRTELSAAGGNKDVTIKGGTIATTSTTDEYCIAPESGSLAEAEVNPLVALAASDTNYITWTITNLGQAGAGTTVMLAATAPNTTKVTGGTALAINTKFALTVNGTPANLVVVKGDKIKITATATGTLANTVTVPIYMLRFTGTN